MNNKKKYLIVNADDFGMTKGITDGIVTAHKNGIVTSASLMVTMPAASYAARQAKKYKQISIGLHGVLSRSGTVKSYIKELNNQLQKFIKLVGTKPTHFDLHGVPPTTKHMAFAAYCFISQHNIAYRGLGHKVINKFYGMKKNNSQPNSINVQTLSAIITNIQKGITVLVCHPGLTNNRLTDPYRTMRNLEHKTLTNTQIFHLMNMEKISLINFREEVRIFEKNNKK